MNIGLVNSKTVTGVYTLLWFCVALIISSDVQSGEAGEAVPHLSLCKEKIKKLNDYI